MSVPAAHLAARFFISGKVQGVWFRAGTRAEAERLGLSGHAINLPDGRVEVVAMGEAAALDALQAWLGHGPPLARVDAVLREAIEPIGSITGFTTG